MDRCSDDAYKRIFVSEMKDEDRERDSVIIER